MYFRVTVQAKPLYLEKDERMEMTVTDGDQTISLILERIPAAELRDRERDGEIRSVAATERAVSAEEQALVETFKEAEPGPPHAFILELEQQLREVAERAIYTYRWYRGIPNAHNPVRYRFGMFYSADGKEWKPVHGPMKVMQVLRWGPGMRKVDASFVAVMQQLVETRVEESVGHELYAEALELKSTNPRSCLLIAVAALETGFKEFVGRLVPHAAWLVENAPTPPLVIMLKKYLPDLPCRLTIKGKVLSPPPDLMKAVDEGVQWRNKVAHGRKKDIRGEELDKLLNATRDILYLLDFYGGQRWAWDHISHDTTVWLVDKSTAG